MKFQKFWNGVVVYALLLGSAIPVIGADLNFTYPEIPLTAPGSLPLTQVNVDFDNANVLHSVWTDDVSSVKQTYGSIVFRDGFVIGKFPAMEQTPDNYALPFIHRNEGDTSKMFVFAINQTAIISNSRIESAYWDLTFLPDAPGVTQTDFFIAGTADTLDRSMVDMLSVNEMVVCAIVVTPDIHVRAFDTISRTWGAPTVIPAGANQYLTMPRLAKDDSWNIYLSYDLYNMPTLEHFLMVRRTLTSEQIIDWLPEVIVTSSMGGAFSAELAVTGSSLFQKTALVYATGSSPIQIFSNVATGNTWPMSGPWPNPSPALATAIPFVTAFKGPEIAYSPDGSRLYIVWADDRESLNAEVYGVTSYDGGMTFGGFEVLTDSAENEFIPETPRIAVGTDLGNLAVSFIRTAGAGSSPFVLLSMADFLDTCDNAPDLYWDTSPGVTVDFGTFLSPPASYRLANAKDRGTLLRDYGLIEQTGVVSLNFYDDPLITGVDFIVGLENANSKGVIRMLGVQKRYNTAKLFLQQQWNLDRFRNPATDRVASD